MVKLNTKFMDESIGFYSQYENELEYNVLNAIRDICEDNLSISDIIEQRGNHIYEHISDWRETLLEWYPFKQGTKILEVGTGFGALTGVLLDKADRVVSLEIKKSRSEIIKERYKDSTKLEVLNINFCYYDTDEKYDYIVIHDIFGYVKNYHDIHNGYVNMLRKLSNLLSDDGVILIATENQLGIKYFSGSIEEYSNKFYTGLNNFDGYNYIRTFTKSEYIKMIQEAGFKYYKIYYPFPDCVFPTEIFTDKILNYIYYGDKIYDATMPKFVFFNEQRLLRTLQNEGLVTAFANAYLFEISTTNNLSNVLYYYVDASLNKGMKDMLITEGSDEYVNYSSNSGVQCKTIVIDKNMHVGTNYIDLKSEVRLDQWIIRLLDSAAIGKVNTKEVVNKVEAILIKICDAIRTIFTDSSISRTYITTKDVFLNNEDIKIVLTGPICTSFTVEFLIWKFITEWYDKYITGNKSFENIVDLYKLYKICSLNPVMSSDYRKHDKDNFNKYDNALAKYYHSRYLCNYSDPIDIYNNGELITNGFCRKQYQLSEEAKEKFIIEKLRK